MSGPDHSADISDATLLAYLVEAASPWQAERVEQGLRRSFELRERLAVLSQRLDAPQEPQPLGWRLPPPGLVLGPAHAAVHLAHAAALGTDSVRPGQVFRVRVQGVVDPEQRRPVILTQRGEGWEVIHPRAEVHDRPLCDNRDRDDGFLFRLKARSDMGRQRWAFAFQPWLPRPDWSLPEADRWRGLQDDLFHGLVPALSLELQVVSPGS